MRNQELSYAALYHQVLMNPQDVALADIEQLLVRYPYSQPLHFAFERRKCIAGDTAGRPGSRAIVLARHASWLAAYVQQPVDEVPVVEVEDDDYVPFEDIAGPSEETFVTDSTEAEEGAEEEVQEEQEGPSEDQRDAIDTLVQEGIGGGDYFAVHAPDIAFEQPEQEIEAAVETGREEERREEDISLYNDELMPYSFRWWLHKTRLEHADTYQPFASPRLPVANKASFDREELDRVILDQQIREHIIHLQNPEDKLSEEVKQRKESTQQPPNQVDEVIERFIREDPQIQPPQPEHLTAENKARKSSEEQFDLVTETLANIYADQAMYVKAIEVYKKLILRFPEKKSYFATRIKELEEKLY